MFCALFPLLWKIFARSIFIIGVIACNVHLQLFQLGSTFFILLLLLLLLVNKYSFVLLLPVFTMVI